MILSYRGQPRSSRVISRINSVPFKTKSKNSEKILMTWAWRRRILVLASFLPWMAVGGDHADYRGKFRWGAEAELDIQPASNLVRFMDLDHLEAKIRAGLRHSDPTVRAKFRKMFTPYVLADYVGQPEALRELPHELRQDVIRGVGQVNPREAQIEAPTLLSPYDRLDLLPADLPGVAALKRALPDAHGPGLLGADGKAIQGGGPAIHPVEVPAPRGMAEVVSHLGQARAPHDVSGVKGTLGFVRKEGSRLFSSVAPEPEGPVLSAAAGVIDPRNIQDQRKLIENWNALPEDVKLDAIHLRNLAPQLVAALIMRLPVPSKNTQALGEYIRPLPTAPTWFKDSNFSLDSATERPVDSARVEERIFEVALDRVITDLDEFHQYVRDLARDARITRSVYQPTTLKRAATPFHLHGSVLDRGDPESPVADLAKVLWHWKRREMLRFLEVGPVYYPVIDEFRTGMQNSYTVDLDDPKGLANRRSSSHWEVKEHARDPETETTEMAELMSLPTDQAVARIDAEAKQILERSRARGHDLMEVIAQRNRGVLRDLSGLVPREVLLKKLEELGLYESPEALLRREYPDPGEREIYLRLQNRRAQDFSMLTELRSRLDSYPDPAKRVQTLKWMDELLDGRAPLDDELRWGLYDGLENILGERELDPSSRILTERVRGRLSGRSTTHVETLKPAARETILSPDPKIRAATFELVHRNFRREFPTSKAAEVERLADYLASPGHEGAALDRIIYEEPDVGSALLAFADLRNSAIYDGIAARINTHPEAASILLAPLRARSEAAVAGLARLASRLTSSRNQVVALDRLRDAARDPQLAGAFTADNLRPVLGLQPLDREVFARVRLLRAMVGHLRPDSCYARMFRGATKGKATP